MVSPSKTKDCTPSCLQKCSLFGERVVPATRAPGSAKASAIADAGIAATENHHMHHATPASRHSLRTSSSVLFAPFCRKSLEIRQPSSVATAPRPPCRARSGRDRRQVGDMRSISARSPELPAAISTLRINRSRPIRLIGEPLKNVRKAASSSVSRKAIGGLLEVVAGDEFHFRGGLAANLFQGQAARQSSQP